MTVARVSYILIACRTPYCLRNLCSKSVLVFPPLFHSEPRGFGFVQFVDPADAADAKYQMDGQGFQGRQLTVVFAEENRKKPTEMRSRERSGSHRSSRSHDRRRTPPSRYARAGSHSRDYSPKRRQYSRYAMLLIFVVCLIKGALDCNNDALPTTSQAFQTLSLVLSSFFCFIACIV
uniref:Serine/arginine-rich protein n=1 Tax=Solanum tuberosum TaxID=4113 RepID=M1D542_SOLTU